VKFIVPNCVDPLLGFIITVPSGGGAAGGAFEDLALKAIVPRTLGFMAIGGAAGGAFARLALKVIVSIYLGLILIDARCCGGEAGAGVA